MDEVYQIRHSSPEDKDITIGKQQLQYMSQVDNLFFFSEVFPLQKKWKQ